jgi:integrase
MSVWAGIRRRNGIAPRKVRAARTKLITTLVEPLGNKLIDVRDRALILIGFAGALRRGEIVALDVEDVDEDADGLVLGIRRSKTDQESEGETRGLPYGSHPATCPVRAWRAWIDASGIDGGLAFRGVDRHGRMRSARLSDRAVADMIKRRAAAVGLCTVRAIRRLSTPFLSQSGFAGGPR